MAAEKAALSRFLGLLYGFSSDESHEFDDRHVVDMPLTFGTGHQEEASRFNVHSSGFVNIAASDLTSHDPLPLALRLRSAYRFIWPRPTGKT